MKKMTKRLWIAAALAAMLAMPAGAWALETAPLSLQPQSEERPAQDAEKLSPFGKERDYMGVTASTQWLLQGRIGGLLLNLRLYTSAGEAITFQEDLCAASTGGSDVRLAIRASRREGTMILQMDQHAVDVLTRVGITEIAIADMDLYVRQTYQVQDLADLREALSLRDGEELCVSGEDEPVTVVSESGVRRQINP